MQKQKRYHIVVKVKIERFINGTADLFETDNFTIEADVADRLAVYRTLMAEFGRCYGAIPMGYKFGKRIVFADNTKGFEYATVKIIQGATAAKGFTLTD